MPSSPSLPGATTYSASVSMNERLGVTIESWSSISALRLHLLALLARVVHAADVHERLLGHLVHLALDDLAEALDRVGDAHVLARDAGELLGDEVRLAEEVPDLARARHRELVVVGQLVHAEDRDDVLELIAILGMDELSDDDK